jgi:hypothetical protein
MPRPRGTPPRPRSRLLNADASRSSLDDSEAFEAVGALLSAFRACRVPPPARASPLDSPSPTAAAAAAAPTAFSLDGGAEAAAAALQPLTLAEAAVPTSPPPPAAAKKAPEADAPLPPPPASFGALFDRIADAPPTTPGTPDAPASPAHPLRRLSARLSASVKRASERFAEL